MAEFSDRRFGSYLSLNSTKFEYDCQLPVTNAMENGRH